MLGAVREWPLFLVIGKIFIIQHNLNPIQAVLN